MNFTKDDMDNAFNSGYYKARQEDLKMFEEIIEFFEKDYGEVRFRGFSPAMRLKIKQKMEKKE